MQKKTLHPGRKRNSGRFFGVLFAATVAVFALFAACERPEPEPEPPTPPVDSDTLPTNKFIGTWVLCAMNDVDSEPPATCDLTDATTDTLVFVDDTTLIHKNGEDIFEYIYESSDHFFVCYWPEPCENPDRMNSNRYYFRGNDQELVLRGNFFFMPPLKNYCFHRIPQD